MDDLKSLIDEFGLGRYKGHTSLQGGSTPACKVTTTQGDFFVKTGEEEQDLRAYSFIETALNQDNVRQCRIFRSLTGRFVSSEGYSVYEWLPGKALSTPTPTQLDALMTYFGRCNNSLAAIPLGSETYTSEYLAGRTSPFMRADSLEYLLDRFELSMDWETVSAETKDLSKQALAVLFEVRDELLSLPKQLTHGDVAPGNILYDGDGVVAIVDFSPYLESHFYSLCVCLYWHHAIYTYEGISVSHIARSLEAYRRVHPVTDAEKTAFFPLFVKAAARLLFAKMLMKDLTGQAPRYPKDCGGAPCR